MSTNTFSRIERESTKLSTKNAGIIGLGFIGEVHARAIRASGHNIRAISATSIEVAREGANKVGADFALTTEEMFSDSEIDVIHICTPNIFHAELATLALESGKHVICEKPLAISSADAIRLTELANKNNLVATVPFIYRYYPTVLETRARLLDSQSPPNLIHGYYLQDWLASKDVENWRVNPDLGGPSRVFGDIGVHWVDLIEFVTGQRIIRLNAQLLRVFGSRLDAASTVTEDGGTIIFETNTGAQGSLVLSQVSAGRKNKLWFSIEGNGYSYVFDQENPDSLWEGGINVNSTYMRGAGDQSTLASRFSVLPAGHPQGYQDCFNAFVADTYNAIIFEQSDGLPRFSDGLRAAQLTNAVLESARTQLWVEVK
jgi:predicted dehydrogenase